MSAQQQVNDLLRGSVAHRIRFTFPFFAGTVTITSVSFAHVAMAISYGRIQIDSTTAFPAGVAGEYIAGPPKVLRVKPMLGREEQGLVLHECTHALFDLTLTHVSANDDEAAAYVVDALYFRMTGLPRPRWNAQLHAAAGAVADGLLRAYQRGTTGIPAVNAAAWASLKLQISLHPVYLSGPAGFVPSLLGTGEYPHNGA